MSGIHDWVERVTQDASPLSPAGVERRGGLRRDLERAVRRRRAARVGLRLGVVAALLVIGAVLGARGVDRGSGGEGPPFRRMDLAILRDDPGALRRALVTTRAVRPGVLLSDDELLDYLESIDRPAGIVRALGTTRLTAIVTDTPE